MDQDERRKAAQLLKEKESESSNIDWMYKGDGKPDTEDYLIGKRISKLYDDHPAKSTTDYHISQFSEQMAHQAKLDMETKMREDPLFAIRKKEDDTKRKLLDNPVKMKQLQALIDQQSKHKKKKKKKDRKLRKKSRKGSDVDSDDDLLRKYIHILKQKKSDKKSRTISQSSEERKLKNERHTHGESITEKYSRKYRGKTEAEPRQYGSVGKGGSKKLRRSRSLSSTPPGKIPGSHHRRDSTNRRHSPVRRERPESPKNIDHRSRDRTTHRRHRSRSPKTSKLTEEEMEQKRREMMDNAKQRDEQRHQNVRRYRDDDSREERSQFKQGSMADFINPMMADHAAKSTVEERIQRNRFKLQRTSAALDKNFTKR